MTSVLKVDNIQNSSGTSAISIDSSGNLTFSNSLTGTGILKGVSEQTATGNSEINFTGIPSGVEVIKFTWYALSPSNNEEVRIRIGDSGGIETTNYTRQSHYATSGFTTAGTSTSSDAWITQGWAGSGNAFYATGELVHAGGNRWMQKTSYWTTASLGYWNSLTGNKELSGEIDRVQFFVETGTFDAGTIRIMYA